MPHDSKSIQRIQDHYENILSSLIDGIMVVDREMCMTTMNAAAEQIAGVKAESVQGRRIAEVFKRDPGIETLARKTLKSGRSYSDSHFPIHGYFEDRRHMGLATSPLMDRSGESAGVVVVFRDLSPVKSLEERLRKGERLASLGVLAAGMAHEIKNPLGGIRGAAQLLDGELEEESRLREYTNVMLREVLRVNNIVQGLLDFARPMELKLVQVNLHQLLDRVLSLVQMEDPKRNVRYVKSYDPSLPPLLADSDQLIQVLLNLVRNGIDAMEGKGNLTLTTRMLPGYRVDGLRGKQGMIAVDVEDSGCGIEPEEIGRIFDPFYTSKPQGVGLGLALCHRIVEEHGGKIDATSTPGKGTRMRVALPISFEGKAGGGADA